MLDALVSANRLVWLSIGVKALAYVSTLLAIGSVLAVLFLRSLTDAEQQRLRQIAVLMAIAAAVFSLLRVLIRASFLTGGTWAGATDPMMLGIVMESPLGTASAVRLIGLALVFAILARTRLGQGGAALGVLLVAASFALRGHALEQPRAILAVLITLHVLGLAFWVGVFAPLLRLSKQAETQEAGALAEEFGRKALWVVAGLVIAGLAALVILSGGRWAILATAYGQFFVVKLALFASVFALAAWNKLQLTPGLQHGLAGAGAKMLQSLRLEVTLLLAILIVTATLTSISAP